MTLIVKGFVCTISDNNINIKDSYKVLDKSEMSEILYIIQRQYPDCNTFKRK